MGSPQRRRPAPPLACRRLFNRIRNSGEEYGQCRECVRDIVLTGWGSGCGSGHRSGYLVLRYSHPVHPWYIYSVCRPGQRKVPRALFFVGAHAPRLCKAHSWGTIQVRMRCGGEAKITQRKNGTFAKMKLTLCRDAPVASNAPSNLENSAGRASSTRAFPAGSERSDRGRPMRSSTPYPKTYRSWK